MHVISDMQLQRLLGWCSCSGLEKGSEGEMEAIWGGCAYCAESTDQVWQATRRLGGGAMVEKW